MPAAFKTKQNQPSNAGQVPLTAFRLDAHHRGLLQACAEAEFTTKVEIIKRALRAYAEQLGVEPVGRRKPKTKK